MATETKDSLEDQIAHLIAGADATPAPEGCERTPGQFIHWFLGLDEKRRLKVAAGVQANAREASRCFVCDHEGRIDDLQHQVQLGRWLVAEARWIASYEQTSAESVASQLEQLADRGSSV